MKITGLNKVYKYDENGRPAFPDLVCSFDPDETLLPTSRRFITMPGDVIFSSGQRPSDIFLIKRGQAVLSTENGSELVIDAGEGESTPAFGMLESLAGGKFGMTLRSLTKNEVCVIDTGEFVESVRHSPKLSFRLAEMLAGMYEQTVGLLKGH